MWRRDRRESLGDHRIQHPQQGNQRDQNDNVTSTVATLLVNLRRTLTL